MKRVAVVLWIALATLLALTPASAQGPQKVYVLTVDGAISNATADYLDRTIKAAGREGAEAVVILLDTPGGDVTAMLKIMETLENAQVPVIVYVWPRGGMAASAGTLIALAASGAAMAPHTTIGAAHPVAGGGAEVDSAAIEKLTNAMVEHAGVFAARRGQAAVDWAERAIRESETASEQEALELGVIDLIADDLDDLLTQFDGRTVPLGADEVTLHTANATVQEMPMSPVEQILSMLINPNVAFILLVAGIQLIFIELSAPGGWVAGFLGALCLALATYAMSILPLNWLGLALIGASFVLFFLDLKTPGIEALTFAGIGTLVAGALILFNTPVGSPYGKVSIPLVVVTGLALGAFFVFIVAKGLRALRLKPVTGAESLIGRHGTVRAPLDPNGTVWVAGEIWTASADDGPFAEGERVEIVAVEGLRLRVQRSTEESLTHPEEVPK
ncbi:MAG: nodulation protein NfeD [Chloroflexi bacterium]|nr:nodulation protein NfeD [Chloroflexota bacterium]